MATEPRETVSERAADPYHGERPFEEIFLEYYPRVMSVLYRLTGDRARAEELADDVFLKLHRQSPSPEGFSNLGGWLYRTATRMGIDALRAGARRRRFEVAPCSSLPDPGHAADPLEDLLKEETRAQVRRALARMKPARARLLVLRASGLSYRQIAGALDCRLASVGTLLARAEAEFTQRYSESKPEKERR